VNTADIEYALDAIGPPITRENVVRILDRLDPPPAEREECLKALIDAVLAIRAYVPDEPPGKVRRDLEIMAAALRKARIAAGRLPDRWRRLAGLPTDNFGELDRMIERLDRTRQHAATIRISLGGGSMDMATFEKLLDRARKRADAINGTGRSGGSTAARRLAGQKQAAAEAAFGLAMQWGEYSFQHGEHFPPQGEWFYELVGWLFEAATGRIENCKRAAAACLKTIYEITSKRKWRRVQKARTV
jgi:hypothetical protein